MSIESFLASAGWGNSDCKFLAGGMSTRKIRRVTRIIARTDNDNNKIDRNYIKEKDQQPTTAILITDDASSKIESYIAVADALRAYNIPAPQIYGAMPNNGMFLLEDFGDTTMGDAINQGIDRWQLLQRALEILAKMPVAQQVKQTSSYNWPQFNAEVFAEQACLFIDGYVRLIHQRAIAQRERVEFVSLWREELRVIEKLPQTILLRDFMPDNIMVRGESLLGVIDLQDAGLGVIAYDIASLVESVRRDMPIELIDKAIDYYLELRQNNSEAIDREILKISCYKLALQRHLRVLGILAQHIDSSKRTMIPRVKEYVKTLLNQECCKNLAILGEML